MQLLNFSARRPALLAALLPLAGCGASALAQEVPASYTLGVGDVVGISVWKNDELSVSATVRPDGMVSVPLVGSVRVLGLTPTELEESLERSFERFITAPNVFVVVEEIHSMQVFVTGKVQTPGPYDVLRPTRLLQVLAMAGGPTPFAKTKKIVVLRPGGNGSEQRFEVNLKAVEAGKRPEDNLLLEPGDTIVVP